jgi:hypothetical protein
MEAPATGGLGGGDATLTGIVFPGLALATLLTMGSGALVSFTLALPIVMGIMEDFTFEDFFSFLASSLASFFVISGVDAGAWEGAELLLGAISSKPKFS